MTSRAWPVPNVARLLENASQSRSFGGGFERKPPSVTLGCIVSELRERPLKKWQWSHGDCTSRGSTWKYRGAGI